MFKQIILQSPNHNNLATESWSNKKFKLHTDACNDMQKPIFFRGD